MDCIWGLPNHGGQLGAEGEWRHVNIRSCEQLDAAGAPPKRAIKVDMWDKRTNGVAGLR